MACRMALGVQTPWLSKTMSFHMLWASKAERGQEAWYLISQTSKTSKKTKQSKTLKTNMHGSHGSHGSHGEICQGRNSREPLVQWSSMLARHRNSSEASSLRDLRCEIFKSRWDESEPGVPMPSKNPQNRCRMRSSLGRSLWGARPRTVIQFIVHESRQTRQSPLYFCFFYFFDLTISWVLDVRSFRLQVCQWNWVFFQLSSFVSLEIEIASRVSWAAVKTAERVPRSTWNGCSANWKDLQGVSDMEHGGKTMENIGCANSRGERCENPGRFTWTAGRIVMIVLWWMLETQTAKSLKQWKTLWASMS